MAERLDAETIGRRCAALPNWDVAATGDAIERRFDFADFNAAFAFMTEVALAAAAMDHHPDWTHRYSRVDIRLTTHAAGGLSERDFDLAARINAIAAPAR